MSKQVLIVEGDAALSHNMRTALEGKGFSVEETADGKGSVELIRRQKPDLVLLAVELPAGQNGYIICGKLKKDDELKSIPVVIVGNPDGFAQHKKLKTRADDYLAKPLDVADMVERIGSLIGYPEPPANDLVDESLSLTDLVEDASPQHDSPEEIAVENPEEATVQGDPELDMLDAAFEDMSNQPTQAINPPSEDEPLTPLAESADEPMSFSGSAEEEAVVVAQDDSGEEDLTGLNSLGGEAGTPDTDSALSALGEDDIADKTMVMESFTPPAPTPASPRAPAAKASPLPTVTKPATTPTPVTTKPASTLPAAKPALTPAPATAAPARTTPVTSSADAAELRNLRTKVAELQAALDEAQGRTTEAEGRIQGLEAELSAKTVEAEAARTSSGKNDKEFFSLREAANRKDKEILRLKNEINEKDKEIVELRDREMQLEQQASEANGELTKRDAQIKTLTAKADQLTAERKKVDQQLQTSKDEARSATARLTTLQGELDQAHTDLESANTELDGLRNRNAELDEAVRQIQDESSLLRQQVEDLRTSSDTSRQEAEELRTQLEQARAEAEALTSQAATHEEEANTLRRQVVDLQEATSRNEERLTKLYARIKGDEKVREKAKKALGVALQLLEEQPAPMPVAGETDEPAIA